MRVALIGFGHVGRAFARLLGRLEGSYPFRIAGIQTARHGTSYSISRGVPVFGPPAANLDEFFDRCRADVAIEITTLNPADGEPAISHIETAIRHGLHVITANKGPIAHAYHQLREKARQAQVEFRFESTVMDGTPVFNLVRQTLPAVQVLGFAGVLNSTSQVVLDAMARGATQEAGVAEAQRLGIAEADVSFDLDGWDSAAKTAALANVLMDARTTPQHVARRGLRDIAAAEVARMAQQHKRMALVSRATRTPDGVALEVGPELLEPHDLLAAARDRSNLLVLHTDLMGTLATLIVNPGVEQTAYGLFSDLVDIARSV